MKVVIEISKITVLTGSGPDKLILHTGLIEGTWPYTGLATLTLDVASGLGVEYCELNFPGVPVDTIKI